MHGTTGTRVLVPGTRRIAILKVLPSTRVRTRVRKPARSDPA
jgi:hypothetical protein